jgi:hypothetical protein
MEVSMARLIIEDITELAGIAAFIATIMVWAHAFGL